MNLQDKEIVKLELSVIKTDLQHRDKLIGIQLAQILEQTTKTNGRVNRLEGNLTIFNWFADKPKRLYLLFILIPSIKLIIEQISIKNIEKIINLI